MEQLKYRKWIVTYDNANAIKAMYSKVSCIEFELQYTLQKKYSGSEVMFFAPKIKRPPNEKDFVKIQREITPIFARSTDKRSDTMKTNFPIQMEYDILEEKQV